MMTEPIVQIDTYSPEILQLRWTLFMQKYVETNKIIKATGLLIRQENMPEDITENMVKFIIRREDPTVVWSKCVGKNGDLCSDTMKSIEVKSFTSNGPCSFGPNKKFDVIYFLDLRNMLQNRIILFKMNLTNNSPEWKNLKMNKTQTHEDQCNEKRRPHICWDKIYSQLNTHCQVVFDDTFENIFTF